MQTVVAEVCLYRQGRKFSAMVLLADDAIEFGKHKLAINQAAFDQVAELLRTSARKAHIGLTGDLAFTEVERGRG